MEPRKIYYDIFEGSYGGLSGIEAMANEFAEALTSFEGINVLFAGYSYEDYSGDTFVLFEKDGELYEVNGGHCSCYGLEGQWCPELTSVAALRDRMTHRTYGVFCDYAAAVAAALDEYEGRLLAA